jgi:hypothetical protein
MSAKRDLSGLIEVDDHEYRWVIKREPQWCTSDGWRGMVVSLHRANAPREALLEFPMPSARRSALQPQLRRPQVNEAIIANGIRAALAAGWEPTGRGKPAVFEVDANGN